jgi:adenylate kinase family enzyme
MKRVVVLGCAGSGKTSFARALARRLAVPLICLDEYLPPGIDGGDLAEFRAEMARLHEGESWISDGNFAGATFDIRLPRADTIVWIERTRLSCAWRAIVRLLRPGEAHKLSGLPRVLKFIAGFDRINRPRIEALRMKFGPDVAVVRLNNDREIAGFLSTAARKGITASNTVVPKDEV